MQRKHFKMLTALALAVMLAAVPALAEDTTRSAKGTTRSVDTEELYAPVGGQLLPFDLEQGDALAAGTAAVSIRPRQVLAANDGIIRSLKAEVGDQASAVAAQFDALCSIERTDVAWVRATTKDAYDKPENRAIVLGESLRVYNGKDSNPLESVGTVISVDGKDFVVEIPSGVYDLEDDVKLYRGIDGAYRTGDRVGKGEVERAALIPMTADGVIAGIHVTEGQAVKRGDVLFTMDAANTVHTQSASTVSMTERGGAISALYVTSGQYVEKGQLLMKVSPLDALEFLVDVDELDIASIRPGDSLSVKVDALNQVVPAAVKTVYPLGVTVLDTTKYQVALSIQSPPEGLLPGMRVTAYWGGPVPENGN